MSATKPVIVYGENGQFSIERQSAKGQISRETLNGNEVSSIDTAVRFAVNQARGQQTQTDKWQSLLCYILAMPCMDEYRGAGDPMTGKTSDTFRDALRKAEDQFFDQCHADKVAGIPVTEKGRTELVRAIRNDKNYSNIKATCAKYFAFVGALPRTDAGYLIPRPVMLAHVSALMNITPEDTSMAGRLRALLTEIEKMDKRKDIESALFVIGQLSDAAKGRLSHVDEVATNAAQSLPPNAGDTVQALQEIAKRGQPVKASTEAATV
jgi:hypothetical protein